MVPVNGMFAGVRVPPGTTSVELHVRRWPLLLGLLLAMAGAVLCVQRAFR
jgi:hypothetical protein